MSNSMALRRLFSRTHAEVENEYADAREVRRQHLVSQREKADKKRRTLIKAMLKYENITIFRSRSSWRKWLSQMRRVVTDPKSRERSQLSKMSEQFNCLRYRCGVRYGLIPRKTHMKKVP